MRRSYTYVSVVLIVALLMMPMALEINSMTRFAQNFTYPTISIPTVLKNALIQYGKIEIQKSNDIYFVTSPFTGVDININLNGSSLLQYGIANETLPPDANFTASIENFLSDLNESSTLSIIVTVSSFNESMMLYSAYRNFLDIALEWAETTSDAVIIVANDMATPANIIELLKQAQQNENVTEINMVVLTHGVLTNETHGMLLWDEDSPKIVEPGLLYQYYARISKLNFVFLPFCSVEDEFEIYGNNSIKGFFLNIGADEVIGGTGELALNTEYLSWVQDILLGGTWFDEYGYFEIPVYDNESEEWLTLIMEYNFSVTEETLPVIQGNETSLGISISSGGGHSYRTISKRTSVSVALKKGVSRTTVRRISTSKVGIKSWTHISGRAKLSMIEGYIIDGGSSHKSKKTSNSINAKLNSYKSKIEKAKKEALGSFVIADKIISKIYGGYVAAKSKLKRMIYRYFNWIYGFPASLIWSVILSKVLKGVDWLISRISRDRRFKSLISVAYNMLKAGKSSWELALALIGWGVTKFASSILKYFGSFTNWILSKFGSVGNWLKKLIKGWVDPAMSFVSSRLAYFEKKLKNSLSTIAQSLASIMSITVELLTYKLIEVIKDVIKGIEETAVQNMESIANIVGAIIEKIDSVVSTISTLVTAVNIVQAIVEISTAGIGTVVTRIILPLIAAVVVNQVLPNIVKSWVGVNLAFKPISIDDVITVLLNGLGGLVEIILPRILSIVALVGFVHKSVEYLRENGVNLDEKKILQGNILLGLIEIVEHLIIQRIRSELGGIIGADAASRFAECLSELMEIIFSGPDVPITANDLKDISDISSVEDTIVNAIPTDTKVRIDRIVRQMLMDIKYPQISERVKSYGIVTIVVDAFAAILSAGYILTIDKYNIRNFYISGKKAKLLLWSLVALGALIQGISSGPYVSLLLSHGTTSKENKFMRFVFSIADTLASVIILITKLDKVLADFKSLAGNVKDINYMSKAIKTIYTVFKVFSVASSVLFESDDELRLAKEGFTIIASIFGVFGTLAGAAAYIQRNEQFFKEYEEKIKNEILEGISSNNLMKRLLIVFFASYIAKMAIVAVSAIKKELGNQISFVNNFLSIAIATTAIYLMQNQIDNKGKFGPLDQVSVLFAGIGLVTAGIGILGRFYK